MTAKKLAISAKTICTSCINERVHNHCYFFVKKILVYHNNQCWGLYRRAVRVTLIFEKHREIASSFVFFGWAVLNMRLGRITIAFWESPDERFLPSLLVAWSPRRPPAGATRATRLVAKWARF